MLAKHIRGIVQETPEWAKEFPLGAEIAVKVSKPEDPTWGTVAGYADGYEYPVEESRPWPYDTETVYHKTSGQFISVRLYDGTELLVALGDVSLWQAQERRTSILGHLLCRLGVHAWEKHVAKKGIVRNGFSFGGWITFADQNGLQSCERAGCHAKRKVSRSGIQHCENKDMKWEPVRE